MLSDKKHDKHAEGMQRTGQKLKIFSGADALMQCMLVLNNLIFANRKKKVKIKMIRDTKSNALTFSTTYFVKRIVKKKYCKTH